MYLKNSGRMWTILASGIGVAVFATTVNADVISVVATDDATIRNDAGYAGLNMGGATQLIAGEVTNGNSHVLLRFNLPNLPAGATINSVTLVTYSDTNGTGTNVTISAYELTTANMGWVEGNYTSPTNASGNIAWNGQVWSGASNTGTTWAGGKSGAGVADTDYINTLLASFNGNSSTIGAGTKMSFTSTTDFTTTVTGHMGAEFDLVVMGDAATTNFFRIKSTENLSGSAFAPTLVIDYTPVPEPASLGILAVSGFVATSYLKRRK